MLENKSIQRIVVAKFKHLQDRLLVDPEIGWQETKNHEICTTTTVTTYCCRTRGLGMPPHAPGSATVADKKLLRWFGGEFS